MIELVPKLIPTGPALGVMATLTQYLSDPRADFSVRLANFFMYTFIHPGFLSECVYQLTRSALFFIRWRSSCGLFWSVLEQFVCEFSEQQVLLTRRRESRAESGLLTVPEQSFGAQGKGPLQE